MIHLKSDREIEKIRTSCRIAAEAMLRVIEEVAAGTTTLRLDQVADTYIRKQGAVASAKNYKGYPRSICVSVNEVVVHGIPGEQVLEEGDLLAVDIAAQKDGYHGDMNVSVMVGAGDVETRRLLEATRQALELGLQASEKGKRLGDIGHAIHEEPQLLHFGLPGTGRRLQAGMVFTIEPMVNQGRPGVRVLEDEWTAVTEDGKLSAQFEHTVAITREGPDVLSRFADLPF